MRFGSGEIYNVVEGPSPSPGPTDGRTDMGDQIDDSLAIGQKTADDERVVLFVKTRDGKPLDDALRQRIKSGIAKALSTRHVPAVIDQCPDIPYGTTGKKLEVRDRSPAAADRARLRSRSSSTERTAAKSTRRPARTRRASTGSSSGARPTSRRVDGRASCRSLACAM